MKNESTQISHFKKITLNLICVFALQHYLIGQSLTLANVGPVTGDSLFYKYSNYIPAGPTGLNLLFNYSLLVTDTNGYSKKYVSPVPFQYMSFPANYTLATTSMANSLSVYPPNRYFKSDNTGLYEIAVAGYANSPYNDLIMKLPFTLNQKDSINSFYKDLAKGKDVSGSIKLTADATGTLITPSGTYNNTYRFHKNKFTEYTTSFYGGKETSIGDVYS